MEFHETVTSNGFQARARETTGSGESGNLTRRASGRRERRERRERRPESPDTARLSTPTGYLSLNPVHLGDSGRQANRILLVELIPLIGKAMELEILFEFPPSSSRTPHLFPAVPYSAREDLRITAKDHRRKLGKSLIDIIPGPRQTRIHGRKKANPSDAGRK